MRILFITAILALLLAGCSDTEPTNPNGGSGTNEENNNNVNYNPQFSFSFKGANYNCASTTNTLGSKIYLLGLDADGNLLLDLDVPVTKDEVKSGISFKIENENYFGNCIFYIDNKQWSIEGGSLNVTKNDNNRISGDFSGTAYQMDYSTSPPTREEEAPLTNGVFKDLEFN